MTIQAVMLYKINYRLRSNPTEPLSEWVRFAADRTEAVQRFMDSLFADKPNEAVKIDEVTEISIIGDMGAIQAIDDATKENTMQPHQQRVVSEQGELAEKTEKLGTFLFGNTFNGLAKEEQDRLIRQFTLMKLYLDVLDARIATFLTR